MSNAVVDTYLVKVKFSTEGADAMLRGMRRIAQGKGLDQLGRSLRQVEAQLSSIDKLMTSRSKIRTGMSAKESSEALRGLKVETAKTRLEAQQLVVRQKALAVREAELRVELMQLRVSQAKARAEERASRAAERAGRMPKEERDRRRQYDRFGKDSDRYRTRAIDKLTGSFNRAGWASTWFSRGLGNVAGSLAILVGAGGTMWLLHAALERAISLQVKFSQMRFSLGAQFMDAGYFDNWERASSAAVVMRDHFRRMARERPGSLDDWSEVAKDIIGVTRGTGASLGSVSKLVESAVASQVIYGLRSGTVGMDIRQLLMGVSNERMIQTPTLRRVAHPVADLVKQGKSPEALDMISQALSVPVEALNQYGRELPAQFETFMDNINELLRIGGIPFFEQVNKQLVAWNHWLDQNQVYIEDMARSVGQGLVKAFQWLANMAAKIRDNWEDIVWWAKTLFWGVIYGKGLMIIGSLISAIAGDKGLIGAVRDLYRMWDSRVKQLEVAHTAANTRINAQVNALTGAWGLTGNAAAQAAAKASGAWTRAFNTIWAKWGPFLAAMGVAVGSYFIGDAIPGAAGTGAGLGMNMGAWGAMARGAGVGGVAMGAARGGLWGAAIGGLWDLGKGVYEYATRDSASAVRRDDGALYLGLRQWGDWLGGGDSYREMIDARSAKLNNEVAEMTRRIHETERRRKKEEEALADVLGATADNTTFDFRGSNVNLNQTIERPLDPDAVFVAANSAIARGVLEVPISSRFAGISSR